MFGWTDNYVRIAVPFSPRIINSIQYVEIGAYSKEGFHYGTLNSTILEEEKTIQELID